MQKKITAICLTAGLTVAMADTSTNTGAKGITPEIQPHWEHSVSAGVTLTRGNSDTTLFTASFLAAKKTKINEYSFGLSGAYGNNQSADTVNNYKAFGQWNHLFSERLYGYIRADALRDVIQNIDYRFNVGPGIGYYFVKTKMTYLAGEAGAGFEAEHLGGSIIPANPPTPAKEIPGQDLTFATVRLADRFEHKFNDHARVWQTAEILPQIDKSDNFIVNFEIGIETAVTKSLTLKTFLDKSYQNRPASGKLKNDVQIVAAVGYKF